MEVTFLQHSWKSAFRIMVSMMSRKHKQKADSLIFRRSTQKICYWEQGLQEDLAKVVYCNRFSAEARCKSVLLWKISAYLYFYVLKGIMLARESKKNVIVKIQIFNFPKNIWKFHSSPFSNCVSRHVNMHAHLNE